MMVSAGYCRIAVLFSLIVPGCTSLSRGACSRFPSPLAKFERSQVYFPVKYPEGDWKPQDLDIEDAWFTARDGTRCHGWFVSPPNPRAVALFAHGNAGNVTHRAETLRMLHDRHRIAVLMFDYRGFGKSKGVPCEKGILQDARAARAWLARRTGITEGEIVLMGRSLGGGVVVDLAANDGARGLVLASTFTSLPDVAKHHLPLVPAKLLMANRLESIVKIGRYKGPLLQSHGDADTIIPFDQGQRLHAAAEGPKEFITIPGGNHNSQQSEEYRQAFERFIDSLP